jgi:hypothetical protein
MRQIYFCPNCRAPIGYGDRFCGNCGINLEWVTRQIPAQPLPQWYDCHYPEQQQTCGGQQLQCNQPPYNQALVSGYANQNQQRYMHLNHVATSSGKRSSVDVTAKPISDEISKLLADFFDKQAKCSLK